MGGGGCGDNNNNNCNGSNNNGGLRGSGSLVMYPGRLEESLILEESRSRLKSASHTRRASLISI